MHDAIPTHKVLQDFACMKIFFTFAGFLTRVLSSDLYALL